MMRLSLRSRQGHPLRVLCLGAHCDDIEIGAGATLLRWIDEYPALEMTWVVFSAPPPRDGELRASAIDYGGSKTKIEVVTAAIRDGFFPAEFAALKESFEGLKRLPVPDVVLTHYREDRHQDHRAVSDLTYNTFREHLVLEYEVPKWDGDLSAPNTFVPCGEQQLQRKIELLRTHYATQRSKDWFTPDLFAALPRLRGMECRSPSGFAEAFYGRKLSF